jgi:hypothetical protein
VLALGRENDGGTKDGQALVRQRAQAAAAVQAVTVVGVVWQSGMVEDVGDDW